MRLGSLKRAGGIYSKMPKFATVDWWKLSGGLGNGSRTKLSFRQAITGLNRLRGVASSVGWGHLISTCPLYYNNVNWTGCNRVHLVQAMISIPWKTYTTMGHSYLPVGSGWTDPAFATILGLTRMYDKLTKWLCLGDKFKSSQFWYVNWSKDFTIILGFHGMDVGPVDAYFVSGRCLRKAVAVHAQYTPLQKVFAFALSSTCATKTNAPGITSSN